jgi:hypothetical protein
MSIASALCLLVALYCWRRYKKGSPPHKFYSQGFFFLLLATLLTLTRRITDPKHPVYLLGFVLLLVSVGAAMASLYKGWKMSRTGRATPPAAGRPGDQATS